MHKGHHHKHHPLVAGGQVVQKLLRFLALQFHVIRDNRAEVVGGVLLALPVRHVRFDSQELVLHFSDRFIRRDWNDVDGKHQVAVQFAQLGYHRILDVTGVLAQVQHMMNVK